MKGTKEQHEEAGRAKKWRMGEGYNFTSLLVWTLPSPTELSGRKRQKRGQEILEGVRSEY